MNTAVRRIAYIIAFVLIGLYGFVALQGPQGIPALLEKRHEIRQLQEQNANLERENAYKRDRIRKLKENTSEQEMEIRKNLHKLRQGETSFILPDAPKTDTAKPADDGSRVSQ